VIPHQYSAGERRKDGPGYSHAFATCSRLPVRAWEGAENVCAFVALCVAALFPVWAGGPLVVSPADAFGGSALRKRRLYSVLPPV